MGLDVALGKQRIGGAIDGFGKQIFPTIRRTPALDSSLLLGD